MIKRKPSEIRNALADRMSIIQARIGEVFPAVRNRFVVERGDSNSDSSERITRLEMCRYASLGWSAVEKGQWIRRPSASEATPGNSSFEIAQKEQIRGKETHFNTIDRCGLAGDIRCGQGFGRR